MAGTVEAVTKELKLGVPFKNSCRRLIIYFEFHSCYMEQMLGETLLEIRNFLTEFVFFSHR